MLITKHIPYLKCLHGGSIDWRSLKNLPNKLFLMDTHRNLVRDSWKMSNRCRIVANAAQDRRSLKAYFKKTDAARGGWWTNGRAPTLDTRQHPPSGYLKFERPLGDGFQASIVLAKSGKN